MTTRWSTVRSPVKPGPWQRSYHKPRGTAAWLSERVAIAGPHSPSMDCFATARC
ncbi:MAG: hypothetical protein DWH79_11655 [Planctomycetota bacterium]|nr:MAG: hypothetical protein DWH79_11655 [Planctomycetota bacterium]